MVGDVSVLRGLLAVLLLDAACGLDPQRARDNEIILDVVATGAHAELAIEARGTRAAVLPGGADSFGVALAKLAATMLGKGSRARGTGNQPPARRASMLG